MPFPPPPYTRIAPNANRDSNARPLPVPGAASLAPTSPTIDTTFDTTPSPLNPFYDAASPTSIRGPPPPFSVYHHRPTLNDLPQHVLLQVIYTVVDPDLPEESYRWGLYWLAVSLRLVSRNWYTACMHVLRSAYLPAYVSHIRPPYSANPYPLSSPASLYASTYSSSSGPSLPALAEDAQRETAVLDMFIAFQVRQNVLRDESELHLEAGHEGVKDLFELLQPRARMEDLVRKYALRAGVVSVGTNGPVGRDKIPFRELSVNFSSRKVGLVRSVGGRKRIIAEVGRERMESLESAAKRIVGELVKGMDVIR
ncbi:hypothetical protein DACRYDRAFT_85212 [Dacryopinax primogenitus]|uniref:F-box domain-containing protein n=1 Tax=Dacryopinax primogenitus (strain DJM 731) TaxID=1858805 RepID=M5FPP0_DACPD|nr:uncharacterized protein DACRYDRAFT_85212 [Dacryopinax primogenitus]EJT97203.1 hypothetical protein DACRYDRAFT_85212 [Dacryopinax primogenitus]